MSKYKIEIEVSKEEVIQIFACINTFIFMFKSSAPLPGVDVVGNVLIRILGAFHKKLRENKDVGITR
jgi:hypothetical protein